MIEKIKDLIKRRDKALAKTEDMKKKIKPALAKVVEAEDLNKPAEKHRAALQKIKEDIEISMGGVGKAEADLKNTISNFVDSQIKNYPAQKVALENERYKALKQAGESIGRASLVLQTLGPDGASVASGILNVMRKYDDICAPIILARANFLNSHDEVPTLLAMKSLHARLANIIKNPEDKNRLIDKYYHAAIKNDFDFLVGK